MLISIIVPVYNSEKYLKECISSILNQTYKKFELILINDGSTDNSLSICEIYRHKDDRINLINQENSGVSVARNKGLEVANGEWITFIDSDDYIHVDFLDTFYKNINKKNDFILQNVVQFDDEISYEFISYFDTEKDPLNFFKTYSPHLFYPWSRLFKKEIIKNNKIEFEPKISFAEDALFIMTYLNYCKCIKTINKVGYYYRDTPNSLITKAGFDFETNTYLFYQLKSKLLKLITEDSVENKKIIGSQLVQFCNRVLISIYKDAHNNQLVKTNTLLKEFFKDNNYIIYALYKNSKGLGLIITYLLKLKQIFLVDKIFKYIIFR